MRLCMHTSAHETVHSLIMAWAERMIETRKSAMTLVCCSARLFYLSFDIACDIVKVLQHTVVQNCRRFAAVHCTKP